MVDDRRERVRAIAIHRRAGRALHALSTISAVSAFALAAASTARADQGGVPFWFSGQMASLSATAPSPGATLGLVGYGYTGSAGASKAFEIGTNVVADIKIGLRTTGA